MQLFSRQGTGHKLVMQSLVAQLQLGIGAQTIVQRPSFMEAPGAGVDFIERQIVRHTALEVGKDRFREPGERRDRGSAGPAILLQRQLDRHLVVGQRD